MRLIENQLLRGQGLIAETIENPDNIGGEIIIEEIVENLPDMENKNRTLGLDNLGQTLSPDTEKIRKNDC